MELIVETGLMEEKRPIEPKPEPDEILTVAAASAKTARSRKKAQSPIGNPQSTLPLSLSGDRLQPLHQPCGWVIAAEQRPALGRDGDMSAALSPGWHGLELCGIGSVEDDLAADLPAQFQRLVPQSPKTVHRSVRRAMTAVRLPRQGWTAPCAFRYP